MVSKRERMLINLPCEQSALGQWLNYYDGGFHSALYFSQSQGRLTDMYLLLC